MSGYLLKNQRMERDLVKRIAKASWLAPQFSNNVHFLSRSTKSRVLKHNFQVLAMICAVSNMLRPFENNPKE